MTTITTAEVDLELTVTRRRDVAAGVVELEFGSGTPLPPWSPGAHVELRLPDGLARSYSLCGDPEDSWTYRTAVLLEPESRGGSRYVHDHLHAGAQVTVRGPRNHFALRQAARYVFIAGGIGITPILTMVRAADAAGADWQLLYGGRTRASMAYANELTARYGDRVRLRPQDEYGLLDLAPLLDLARPRALVYSCGPEPLLAAVAARCAHWAPDSLHVERFVPKEQAAPVLAGPFEVELAASGTSLLIPPDRTILQCLQDEGIEISSSCEEGTCGTCEVRVLAGAVEHRDSVLSDAEQRAGETMMVCCSRAAGPRLVLDL